MEEQVVGQPPVNKKKSLAVPSAGLQSEALASDVPPPSPAPSPSPTPHPGEAFLSGLTQRGLYDPAGGTFQGLGALAALNNEMTRMGGLAAAEKTAPWLVEAIMAQKGGTPFSLAKRGKEILRKGGKVVGTRETQQQ